MTNRLRLTPYARLSRRSLLAGIVTVASAGMLVACSGSATTPSSTTAAATSAVAAVSPAAAAASPAVVSKVNANSANVAELQRTFEAAGITIVASGRAESPGGSARRRTGQLVRRRTGMPVTGPHQTALCRGEAQSPGIPIVQTLP